MFQQIIFYTIFGMPLVAYGGMITLLCMLFTASIPLFLNKRYAWATFGLHKKIALTSLTLAIIHGALGIIAFI